MKFAAVWSSDGLVTGVSLIQGVRFTHAQDRPGGVQSVRVNAYVGLNKIAHVKWVFIDAHRSFQMVRHEVDSHLTCWAKCLRFSYLRHFRMHDKTVS